LVDIEELKDDILQTYVDMSYYNEDDRIHVAVHEVLDSLVSTMPFDEVLEVIEGLEDNTEHIDEGVLPPIREGIEKFLRALAYELLEVEVWNDELINALQNVRPTPKLENMIQQYLDAHTEDVKRAILHYISSGEIEEDLEEFEE